MNLRNISNGKIISIGEVNILPGEEKEIPVQYEDNSALDVYVKCGFALITGEAKLVKKSEEELAKEAEEKAIADEKAAEELRKARIASLKGITDEALAALAKDLGIDPATCKDNADVLKKVKVALKK